MAMIAPLWLLLTDIPAAGVIAVMAASGLANGIVNPPLHTIFTLRTPRALRAKVWSVVIAATALLGPVTLGVAGPVLDAEGFVPVVLTLVAVQSVAAIVFVRRAYESGRGVRSCRHDLRGLQAGAERPAVPARRHRDGAERELRRDLRARAVRPPPGVGRALARAARGAEPDLGVPRRVRDEVPPRRRLLDQGATARGTREGGDAGDGTGGEAE